MGKPPFKFRSVNPAAAKGGELQKLEFTGMDQLLAVYADAFLVTGTGGMFTLYFFQGQLPASFKGTLTQTEQLKTEQAKGVARIVVTPEGMLNLVKSMAQHVGLKVESKEEETK